jgi:hypothetical protein
MGPEWAGRAIENEKRQGRVADHSLPASVEIKNKKVVPYLRGTVTGFPLWVGSSPVQVIWDLWWAK